MFLNTGSGGSTWINFNHCHSHMFISYDSHQINQCEYEFENANYDVGHTYGINWKWNNWYHLHFNFNYNPMYFELKTKSVGINEVSVVPMANNMYFIQWIITSYYPNGYKSYRNNFVCIKIACNWYCSHILSTFNWCCKIQLCYDYYLVKLIQVHLSCKSMKEKALAGYNSQQIPNNNDIQRMLIIVISLRWKHFCYYIISISQQWVL